jgi:CheY-like chemotaxis protein
MPLPITELIPTAFKLLDWLRSFRKRKFLIVEDNLDDALLLMREITNAGCIHKLASSAEMAEGMFHVERFDCILLDMQFQGMDGMELLRRILREKPVQIIVITCGEASDLAMIPRSKLIHCVSKPVTSEVIVEILKTMKL